MTEPVFQDADTPVSRLLSQVGTKGWHACADEVETVQAGRAVAGENWAPQLAPYEEWKPKAGSWRDTDAHDGDLFAVGSLRMGATDEVRERMVAIGLENARKQAEREARERADREAREAAEAASAPDAPEYSEVFAVKDGPDGFVLAKADLRRYAKRTGRDRDLVVVLPSQVGGVPVVRIDAAAFSRLYVRGVGVRLLVVPDTVRAVDSEAFSYLAAEEIAIGAGCTRLGMQNVKLSSLRPAIAARRYTVSPGNPAYRSAGGSVFSKDGRDLCFLAPPYGRRVAVPAGVRRIGPGAFATWDGEPEVVECSAELERVVPRVWEDALWLCSPASAAFDLLKKRNVRLASHDVVGCAGCWYDFDERGAVLVAGPPAPPTPSQAFARAVAAKGRGSGAGAASRTAAATPSAGPTTAPAAPAALVVPGSVDGRPVVRVAARALETSPETVVLPEGLREVGVGNACRGCRHLSLPGTLRMIGADSFCSRNLEGVTSVPASVASIGEGCFEYGLCRLEHVGAVVHVSANRLLNCFIERGEEEVAALSGTDPRDYVPFDFARYDQILCQGANLPDRVGALVHRIAVPFRLSKEARAAIVAQLKGEAQAAMEYVAREGDAAIVERLYDAGFIDADTFDAQIELLRRANRTDCVMLLMERHRAAAGKRASVKSRFAL